jgi:hypothetical protein
LKPGFPGLVQLKMILEKRQAEQAIEEKVAKRNAELITENTTTQASKRPPYPKRKVAIMMGYCGSAYQGMQMYCGLIDW